MVRFLALMAAALVAGSIRGEEPLRIRVTAVDGKPVGGASVWVCPDPKGEQTLDKPTPVVADADGVVQVPPPLTDGRRSGHIFVSDAAGRIGYYRVRPAYPGEQDEVDFVIPVIALAERAGRIVDAAGKPIVGATLTPVDYVHRDRSDHVVKPWPPDVKLPPWQQELARCRSDADGRFMFRLPVPDYAVQFKIEARGFGETRWYTTAGATLDITLQQPGTATLTVSGVDPNATKGMWWRIAPPAAPPGTRKTGVFPLTYHNDKFSGATETSVENLAPGQYELMVSPDPNVPALLTRPTPFAVSPGGTTVVNAAFGPTAKATGRVVDPVTGQGIGGAQLHCQVTAQQNDRPTYLGTVTTAADGSYVVHGPAGWFILQVGAMPDGYCPPSRNERRQGDVDPVEVALGQSHEYSPIRVERAVTFSGRVVFADGKPAVGAAIYPGRNAVMVDNMSKVIVDADGNFAIKNLPRNDGIRPHARLGKAVNAPMEFDLADADKPVTITIAEANAATLTGRIEDIHGKSIPGVKVMGWQWVRGVGRQRMSMMRPLPSAVTDRDGRYEFTGLWPDESYEVHVAAEGYAEAKSSRVQTEAAKVERAVPTLRLQRTHVSVHGMVIDADGKPVANVELFSTDGPSRFSSRSGMDGLFTLTGFYETPGFIIAKKDGYRLAAQPVQPNEPAAISIRMLSTVAAPLPLPANLADHEAALAKLTRHLLTRMWETRSEQGGGGRAIERMARFDVATARRWRDEEVKRTDGKTDWKKTIDTIDGEDRFLAVAKTDIDEALALLQNSKGTEGFWAVHRLGEALLPVDQAKAARVAEDAVIRARAGSGAVRVTSMAAAGDLAVRAGLIDGGKKVLLEAAELAEQLPTDGNEAMGRGCCASRLAALDWPRAEKLLESITEARTYNRYLVGAAWRLATVDLPTASLRLTRFRPDNSNDQHAGAILVAVAIARDRPDDATKIIQGITNGVFRAIGYLRLARALAPVDKIRAFALIETAVATCEREGNDFRGWSSSGGQAGFVILAAYRARQIGHPDVPSLIVRALAVRTSTEREMDERAESLVRLAAVLALTDPATARQLLACIGTPDEFVAQAPARDRNWLFALALADPERAMLVVDRKIDAAKAKTDAHPGYYNTGLLELAFILTGKDRFKQLAAYGGVINDEVSDD